MKGVDDGALDAPTDVPPPAPPDPRRRRAARWLLVAVLVTGVATDLVLRSRIDGIAGTVTALGLVAVVLLGVRVSNRQAVALLLAAGVVAALLPLRRSPWLVPLDVLAVAGLLLLGASLARTGSLLDLRLATIVRRWEHVLLAGVEAPGLLLERLALALPVSSTRARDGLGGLARGLGLALPVVVVLATLLASADAVFASMVTVPGDPGSWLGHVVLTAAGVWAACAVLWFALQEAQPAAPPSGRRLGVVEAVVVLGSLVALYSLFVASQVVADVGGEDYVLRTTGLTAAEHARSGFFQLLWAAGLTLAVLLGIHRAAGRPEHGRRVLAGLHGAAVVLTMAVVGVAVRRLGLYQDAYGLTMLRFVCTVVAWWLGGVMALTGIYVVVPWRRAWLPAAVGASAVVVLVGVNLFDPERHVVEHNLARAADGQAVDVGYLVGLSDDAVPALVEGSRTAPPAVRREIVDRLCAGSADPDGEPWYAFSRSAERAERAVASLCGTG